MFQLLETSDVKLEYDREKQSLRKPNENKLIMSNNNVQQEKNSNLPDSSKLLNVSTIKIKIFFSLN